MTTAPGTDLTPSAVDDSDATLMVRVAARDRDAFHRLYERYRGRVFGLIARDVGNVSLAEDLAQDVFVSVWTAAASYRPARGTLDGWLFAIARNKVRDHWRRAHRIAFDAEVERVLEALEAPGDGPDLRAETRLTIRKLVTELAPEHAEVVRAVYLEDRTFDAAARALGIPLGTVKSRIHAALGAMRQSLTESRQ